MDRIPLLNWRANEIASQEGIRVMLNGLDGDSVVSHGFALLRELVAQERWSDFEEEIKALVANFLWVSGRGFIKSS